MTEPQLAKVLWIKDEPLQQILDGRKTVEVRAGYANIRKLQPGQLLRLNDRYLYRLRRITVYASFEELLAHENPASIAPDTPFEALLAELRAIYPPDKEALGAVALALEPASL